MAAATAPTMATIPSSSRPIGLAYMARLTASRMARKDASKPLSRVSGILSSINATPQPLATIEPSAVSSTQAPVAMASPAMASTAVLITWVRCGKSWVQRTMTAAPSANIPTTASMAGRTDEKAAARMAYQALVNLSHWEIVPLSCSLSASMPSTPLRLARVLSRVALSPMSCCSNRAPSPSPASSSRAQASAPPIWSMRG
ncbi:hypothetical protein D3C77_241350 [compost metagenome]